MESSKHAHIQASKQVVEDEPEPVMQAILEVCKVVNNEVAEARVGTCKQAEVVAVVATGDDFDAPSFDLGIDNSQPKSTAEIYDLDDFPNTDNTVTPSAPVQVPMQ
ncbi:hypothetical protein PIB30_050184 [Stylosanthes scabra]|uniref:Uncharacterized protein n=1 Tax=Stylosanthes scabra TaxID=79078 RepID=A0ABU6SHE7_9FABA|nr:hypothetical protein [Stylosanthes scabra]